MLLLGYNHPDFCESRCQPTRQGTVEKRCESLTKYTPRLLTDCVKLKSTPPERGYKKEINKMPYEKQ